MMQYAMIIDLNRCVGCHACAVACRAEWDLPVKEGYRRNWVKSLGPAKTSHGVSFTSYPGLCNHCDKPACVAACPAEQKEVTFTDAKTGKTKAMTVAATWKDPFDGTVQIDKTRCLGCGACADACPYGARYVNTAIANKELGGEGIADKCTFCKPRVEAGLAPACVQTCISDARIFGRRDDPKSKVAEYIKKGAIRLQSEQVSIGPNVYYYGAAKDLELLTKSSAPQHMQKEANLRRRFLAEMIKPAVKRMKGIGLAALAGAKVVQSERKDKPE
jgi:tetrathionate reductase subunit B